MLSSILSLPLDVAKKLDQYALDLSTPPHDNLRNLWQWSQDNLTDADRMSSLLQAHWMQQRAQDRGARRILDVGCYTGLSALAWYEGTRETRAEIFTIEYDPKLAATARENFARYKSDDRIHVLEGRAEVVSMAEMTESFDIIFVDLAFECYKPIVNTILDKGLLAKGGIILVDNVFARGFAVDGTNTANIDPQNLPHWLESGKLVEEFNKFVYDDPRVTVIMLPIFDGISEIRWKAT